MPLVKTFARNGRARRAPSDARSVPFADFALNPRDPPAAHAPSGRRHHVERAVVPSRGLLGDLLDQHGPAVNDLVLLGLVITAARLRERDELFPLPVGEEEAEVGAFG